MSDKTTNHNLNIWNSGTDHPMRTEFTQNFTKIDEVLGKYSDLPTMDKTSAVNAIKEIYDALKSVEGGASGADYIAAAGIPDLTGSTVQALITSLRNKLKETGDGISGADFVNATGIPDLEGATVQTLIESIRNKLKSVTDGSSGGDFVKMTPIEDTGAADTPQSILESLVSKLKSSAAAAFLGATSIPGLIGSSVQSLLTSLKGYTDGHINDINTNINNLSFTGSAHDALVTGSLVDAEGENFGPEGNATYLNGRLDKWEQKTITHMADYVSKFNEIEINKADKSEVNTLAAEKADLTYVNTQITAVASGSPKGTYATLAALQAAYPTGNTNIYVVTADGKWYYWSGAVWTAGGTYQSTGIGVGGVKNWALDDVELHPKKINGVTMLNYFNPNNIVTGYYLQWNGTIENVVVESSHCYTNYYIPISPGDQYTVNYAEVYLCTFYDINKTPIGRAGTSSGTSNNFTFTTPANAYYMRVNTKTSFSNTFTLTAGTSLPTMYKPYGFSMDGLLTNFNPNNLSGDYGYPAQWTNLSTFTVYDPTTIDGFPTIKITKATTDTADVIPYKKVLFPAYTGAVSMSLKIRVVNNGGTYPQTIKAQLNGYPDPVTGAATVFIQSFTINGDGDYIIVCAGNFSNIQRIHACIGLPPTTTGIIIYANQLTVVQDLNPQFHTINQIAQKVGQHESQINSMINPLYGKKLLGNGDSIARGATGQTAYLKQIATRNGMVLENRAVGGGTITAETYSGGTPRFWICRDIVNMAADGDYIILEGMANDNFNSITMGSVTPGYTDALDDTTFCGAFESMLKQTIVKWAGKKIGFVIVHKMSNMPVQFNNYRLKAIEILEKWCIPYIDLYTMGGFNTGIADLKSAYTYGEDGIHPTTAGYEKFYVSKIEAWMKTL